MKRFFIIIFFSLVFTGVFAQNIQVKGKVADSNGNPLPGVNISVEGTKTATVSDVNGNYSITISGTDAVLVFSFVGFNQERIRVKGRQVVNATLAEDTQSLSEVVVVGYGTQKKASVVGAISNMNVKELKKAAPSNLSNALGGRVPGLITRMGDGAIGGTQNRYSNGDLDDAQIYIRGKGTVNDQNPLVLIDGVEGSLSRVNPEDIEQFSVLKDASATAVYGVRGGNGVILITTKRGVVGRPKISATSQFRMMKPMEFPEFLGSYDYATLYNEALKNAGQNPLYTAEDLEHYRTGDSPYSHPDVNWKDVLLKDNFMEQQHVANISGGTEKVRYYIGGEYNQSGGAFVGSKENNTDYNYRRYNLRSNLDFSLTKSTEVLVRVNGQLNDLNFALKGESSGQRVNATAWGDIVNRKPNTSQLYNPNGTYSSGDGVLGWNSLADLYDGGYARRLSNLVTSNFTLNQKLDFVTAGLSFRGLYAYTFGSGSTKNLNRAPSIWTYNANNQSYTLSRAKTIPTMSLGTGFQDFTRRRQFESSLNYTKTLRETHDITAMAAYIETTNEIAASQPVSFRGFAGRLTYSFKNKYLVEGNVGYNGSDQFSKSKRYDWFPAGALGWVPSEEPFFKNNLKFIDYMKIRASYGEVGSDKAGGFRYLYLYQFASPNPVPGTSNTVNGYYSLGTVPTQQIGLVEGALGNDQVTWETAGKTDLGMELRLFKSRLSIQTDLFLEKRRDILRQRADLPLYTGLTSTKLPAMNIGEVTNKGIELSANYKDKIGQLGFNIGGNYTFARNKVDYIAEVPKKYDYQYAKGHPIGTPLLYVWTGKFYDFPDLSNPDVPKPVGTVRGGDLMFKDLNDDGVIDADDQMVTGYNESPEKIFGLNLDLDYRNFYVSTFWQGASNVAIRPGGPIRFEFSPNIQRFHMDERWVYDPSRGLDTRATATYPSLIVGGSAQTRLPSTFNTLNGEYLRLKAAEIGFIFPKHLTRKLRVSDLRVFLSGSNLLTFDHLKKYNIDPEYGAFLNGSTGASSGAYSPQNKFYALGLNVVF